MGDLVEMAAHRYEDLTAFIFQDQQQSYGELHRRSNQVANMLADNGAQPGDRVALYIPNTIQFPEAYFGTLKQGCVPVPLNLRMDPSSLAYVLQDADVDHMIASSLLAEGIREIAPAPRLAEEGEVGTLYMSGATGEGTVDYEDATNGADTTFDRPDRDYDDVAIQPYTSGTTGRPKGVLLSHENLLTALESLAKSGPPGDPEETILLVLPLFHIYALNALMGLGLYSGTTIVLQAVPDPEGMLDLIEQHDVTFLPAVPAIFNMLARTYRDDPDAYDVSSLKAVSSAADALAEDTRRTLREQWQVPMGEGWGMTETAPAGTLQPSRGVIKGAGCIGPPAIGIEIKLVDPETRQTVVPPEELSPYGGSVDPSRDFEDEQQVRGEIAIRGPQVFKGYHNLPDVNDRVFDDEGWFYTRDVARVDEDGYLWMVDRADDMFISGGENIYPAEVENALYEHPEVAEAAVVPVSHELKGEAPVAFVVLESGSEVDEEQLRRFTLDYLATYAHPRRIFFVDELPRSGTEKVQRFKLEEEARQRLDEPLSSSQKL